MAIGTGITEIADSEEELLASSPAAVSEATVDKLSAAAGQDTQAVACPHQEVAEPTANEASACTGVLDVDLMKTSPDVGRLHTVQSELHSTHETAANNASACAADTARQATATPQGVIRTAVAYEQDDLMATDRSHGEAGSKVISPGARHAPGFDERTTSQMNQQNHLTKPHKNHRQPHFQERPIEISDSRSVQQDEISEGRPQNLAVDNHNTGMTLPQGDPERLASSEQKLIRVDNAIPVAQGDLAAAENEAPATRSGSHNERDTTMDLSTAASADSPEAVVAGKTMPGITTDPELMDSDVSPEAADTVFTGVIPGQHQSAAESAAPNDASSSASGEEPHHTTESAAVSCTPPEGIENAGARKDHEANENVSLASGSTAPGKMTDDHNLPSDQHGHKLAPNTTATIECIEIDAAISQNSTVAKNEQDRDGDRPLADSVKGEAVRPISSIVGQDACNEFQPGGVHGSCIAVTQDVGSKAPSVQTAAQSTASQASEPASPLSVAKMSPQEITLAELRAQKAALLSSLRVQPAIQVFMEENGDDDDGEPTEAEIMAAANKIVKEHIKLLHEYNELKDVGQGLMGLIADQRGARIVEVQDEFGIDAND